MEKIKDWIYEISDLIFGIIVLIVILLISIFQLSGWFNISIPNINAEPTINDTLLSENSSEIKSDTTLKSETTNSTINTTPSNVQPINNDVTDAIVKPPVENQQNNEIRNISIAPGTSSSAIADSLYINNIIDSKEAFLFRLIQLKSETRIKAGTFQIPGNSSIDQIIQIITN